MSEQIINVTAILVQQEIANFFVKYPPENPYKVLFSLAYFQEELLKKILAQITNRYVVIDEIEGLVDSDNYLNASLEEKEEIITLINKNIPKVLIANYKEVGEILVKERSKTNLALIWEED